MADRYVVSLWGAIVVLGITHTAAGQPGASAPPVTLVSPVSIRLSASESDAAATLRIISGAATRVSLKAGQPTDRISKEGLPAVIVLSPAEFDLQANVPQDVKLTASQVLYEGDADVDILNGSVKIATIGLSRAPLAVTITSGDPVFRPKQRTTMMLKNGSRDSYELRWMLQIGSQKYCGGPWNQPKPCTTVADWGTVKMPPNDVRNIEIDPPAAWFETPDQYYVQRRLAEFSEQRADGKLWVALRDNLPGRVLPVKTSLHGAWYPGQTMWIFVILSAGAIFSLIVRHWVPNMQRKRELKDGISRVRLKIDGFSDDIDGEVRTLTRVEIHLIDSQRKSTWTIMPDYATVASLCAQGLSMLEKRVDLVEKIDGVFAAARVKWALCPPPSQIDKVDDLLHAALETLKKAQLTDAELVGLRTQIDSACALADNMGTDDPEFGKLLAARLQSMRDEMARFAGTDSMKQLITELPGIFALVTPPPPAPAPAAPPAAGGNNAPPAPPNPPNAANAPIAPIPATRYSLVDYTIAAVQICRDYIWLEEGSKDPDTLDRLKAIRPRLIQHLARQSWGELRLARLLIKQFREAGTVEQVWEAIEAGEPMMYVIREPDEVRYHQLVQLHICFRRPDLNWSGARELVTPEWVFGDGSTPSPRGWTISHFCADSRGKWRKIADAARWFVAGKGISDFEKVSVNFEGAADSDSGNVRRKPEALKITIPVRRGSGDDRYNRAFSEAIALGVSIFIPLVSLITGAREQLVQNPAAGALTVFLLGFSSDALISVFKQRITSP